MAYPNRPGGANAGPRAAPEEGGHEFFGRGTYGRARPVTDYGATMVHWLRHRQPRYKGAMPREVERPSATYIVDMPPPLANLQNPADAVPSRHLHSSLNKIKHPVNVVHWTPDGRRLLTASSSGEFTLWNGMGFNFETIMQAHDVAIRALSYSHNDDWLLSADHDGQIKYWQPNFNNVQVIQGHTDPIRDMAFSPNDAKFVTASDDSTLKIFDFAGGVEESQLNGHGWDAKSVDWHPTKGLLVSGSKDHLVKLWDPRTGRCLTTLHGHKNTITKTVFERVRGHCLATSARDQTARVFDLRMMRDICLLKGHEKDISTLAWHPIHPSLLTTGGADGSLFHYLLDEPNSPPGTVPSLAPYDSPDPSTAPAQTIFPAHKITYAHDFAVWSLDWHPLGHILASGSNDRVTRFWTRARPGETDYTSDRYHIGEAAAESAGTWDRRGNRRQREAEEEQEYEDEEQGLEDQKMPSKAAGFGGIPGMSQPRIPGMGNAPIPIPGFHLHNNLPPPPLPGMGPDPDVAARIQKMIEDGMIPPPMQGGIAPPPPLPAPGGFPIPPPGFNPASFPQPPPNFQGPPPGFNQGGFQPPLPNFPGGLPGLGAVPPGFGNNTSSNGSNEPPLASGGGVRRRGPLPSQEESLQAEQRKGKFRIAR